jgi:hypothetical protein
MPSKSTAMMSRAATSRMQGNRIELQELKVGGIISISTLQS